MIYGGGISKSIVTNEAYFGKSKDLLAIEEQLHVVRKKFINSNKYFGDYNGDLDVLKLNRLFEKAFNIGCFSMNFNRSSMINACTLPVGLKWDTGQALNPGKMKSLTIVDKNGMKFKKENHLCIICNINTGLIFNLEYTDAEILAIILHELGHNFAEALDPKVAMNSLVLSYVQILLDIINCIQGQFTLNSLSPQLFNFAGKIEKQLREYLYMNCKPIVSIYNTGQGVMGFVKDGVINLATVFGMINPFANIMQTVIQKTVNLALKPTGYRNEKIADRFATMHGYGTELTSALSKMEDSGAGIWVKETLNDIPVVGCLLNFAPSMVAIMIGAFDEHPMWSERLEDQIRALEYELKSSSLDPKMKQEIQSQIKQIKDLKSKIIKQSYSNDVLTDPNWIKKWWFSIFASGDTRHALIGDMNKDLNNTITKLSIKEGQDLLLGKRSYII